MSSLSLTLHRVLAVCVVAGLAGLFAAAPRADELSDRIAAATKAADEANQAADAAIAAAQKASEAVEQAMRAAEAAKAAASASNEALAAARATAPGATSSAPSSVQVAKSDPSLYTQHVKCEGSACQIDLWMTRGFRAFSQCQVCHGLDGNGSSFAPSLVQKLKEIDEARFVEVVTNGYKGQVGVMPGWKENPNVMKYMDNLYAYLKARSDGAIPAGKLPRYDR